MARQKHSCGDPFHALAELFRNVKGEHHPARRYLLERIDGELVFRQTEVDAAIENAIASVAGEPSRPNRRVIRLDALAHRVADVNSKS